MIDNDLNRQMLVTQVRAQVLAEFLDGACEPDNAVIVFDGAAFRRLSEMAGKLAIGVARIGELVELRDES
ncbi:MAG: hypothetical protein ACRDYC_00755 [Acidimicrobiales bacterium]